ncbi:hypothetical protein YW3DRAFT_04182 [Streptomyces sp. MnatMP-M77]|uniref:hypothetical protein n=1 Tax=unclassified Streptomyces TaxID=2593676 RepID=UPI0008047C08|nr:hypothetical protein [Streptomyces sp. MnatMP-M77]MYT81080.1 hypothetical protein [Streptomyces sp. SID8364]SBV08181.1 hypothetical protein YW3DRAFT_04182 [Streptomyces sp. MnatMP-M77]
MTTPTSPRPDAHDLIALPGVRQWARRIAEDLVVGRTCLLMLPTGAAAHAEDLLRAVLGDRTHWQRIPPPDKLPEPAAYEPEDDPGPQWSGQPPILDLGDTFLTDLMTAAFGTDAVLTPLSPRSRPPSTTLDRVKGIEARLDSLLPARVPGSDPTIDDVYRRLTVDHADGCIYVLNATEEDDPDALARLLMRLPSSVKAAGLAPEQRPRLLVAATTDRLPATTPDQLARGDVAVHWWWGALGRLDTASVTAVNRPLLSRAAASYGPTGRTHIAEAVTQASIVEVCGPHLVLAATLATLWDGRPESLRITLATACGSHPTAPTPQPPTAHRTGALAHQPPDALRAQWNTGTIDAWDGHLRHHPATLCTVENGTELDKLLWVAHSRTLLPLIDDAREALAAQVLPTATVSDEQLLRLYGPDLATTRNASTFDRLHAMEIGQLLSAKTNGHLRFTTQQSAALYTLRNARNLLSHRQYLPSTTLDLLLTKLSP